MPSLTPGHARAPRARRHARSLCAPRRSEAGRVSPLALVILAALLVGLAVWATSWHRVPAAKLSAAAPHASPADTAVNDAAIDRALAMARTASAAYKSRWHDEVRNGETGDLSPAQREIFLAFSSTEHSTRETVHSFVRCSTS